eukprot:scaffold118508_cov41-Prasinocladus_malaysianus.AAC.1
MPAQRLVTYTGIDVLLGVFAGIANHEIQPPAIKSNGIPKPKQPLSVVLSYALLRVINVWCRSIHLASRPSATPAEICAV